MRDHNDICNVTPFFCMRYFFCLSASPNEDVDNMRNLCKGLVNNHKIKYNNPSVVFYEEILNHGLKNLKVVQSSDTYYKYNAEFFVEKSGFYQI